MSVMMLALFAEMERVWNRERVAHARALDALSLTLLRDQLRSVLATLTEREAGIVRLRFGLTDGQPRTSDEIAHIYGVTWEHIRRIETKTMAKLRHPTRTQALRAYLD